MVPTDKDNTLKLLKQFFTKKLISKNVYVKQVASDMCALISQQCIYGNTCFQNITRNGELFELIGYKTSFIVPLVVGRAQLVFLHEIHE